MRTWIGLTMLVVAAGCAGSRTSSSAEPPVVNELVRLADSGGLDQERLSCAASWLAEGIAADNASSGAAAPVRSPDYARDGEREAARQAEHAAAVTVRAGGAPRAVFYHSYVDDLLSAARDRSARRAQRGNADAGPSAEARDLFEEYAFLWACLLYTSDAADE